MTTAGTDLPLSFFAGLITDVPATELPAGASPYNRECVYPPGAVRTRPGLGNGTFPALANNPTVNYLRTFTDQQESDHLLFLDSLGRLWQEAANGTISQVNSLGQGVRGPFGKSTTLFGREYIAFNDGKVGADIPRQYNGVDYDRVSQEGPGGAPTVIDYLPPAVVLETPGAVPTEAVTSAETTDPSDYTWVEQVGITGDAENLIGFDYVYHTITTYNSATVITAAPHGLAVGQNVYVFGVGAPFDGNWTVTDVPNANTLKFTINVGDYAILLGIGNVSQADGGGNGPSLIRLRNTVTAHTLAAHGYKIGFQVQITMANLLIVAIATIARVNELTTVVCAAAHGLVPGATLNIAGVTNTSFNGQFIVTTVPNATTFTYVQTGLADANDATGTVNDVWQGQFVIVSVPDPQRFTYRQIGPDDSTTVTGAAAVFGSVEAGVHQVTCSFRTRTGGLTKPGPVSQFIASGGKLVSVSQIPTGPPNVVSRVLMFTPKLTDNSLLPPSGSFYTVPTRMEIFDNASTQVILDFSDASLLEGDLQDSLFRLITLAPCAGVTSYKNRLVWWGELNKVQNILNMAFDGGFSGNVPLGWNVADSTAGGLQSGGAPTLTAVFGYAYQILGNGADAVRGLIQQNAAFDYLALPIVAVNTAYSIRARIRRAGLPTQGRVRIRLISASNPALTLAGLAVDLATALDDTFQQFTAPLIAAQAAIPDDLLLQMFCDQIPALNTGAILDEVELFPTLEPFRNTQVRVSFPEQPEAYDALSGILDVSPGDGQAVRSCFKIRRSLYMLKEHSWYGTTDDNVNEPDQWEIDPVSLTVGTLSIQGVSEGDEWVTVVDRAGLFVFWGAQPEKVSQEIQPTWNETNWLYGHTAWTVVNLTEKYALVGLPVAQESPDRVLLLDFRMLNNGEEIAAAYPITLQGTVNPAGRKWAPWSMRINSAAIAERPQLGKQALVLGNGAGNGLVYTPSDTNKTDDAGGIPWEYWTHFTPTKGEELRLRLAHRKSFNYLTGLVIGEGTMDIHAQQDVNLKPQQLPTVDLVDPTVTAAITDITRTNNVLTVTCAAGHGLTSGIDEIVNVDGTSEADLNDTLPLLAIPNPTQFTIYSPGDNTVLGAGGTAGRVARDFEMMTDLSAERLQYQFKNLAAAAGAWFELRRVTPNINEDLTAPVRGGVN